MGLAPGGDVTCCRMIIISMLKISAQVSDLFEKLVDISLQPRRRSAELLDRALT